MGKYPEYIYENVRRNFGLKADDTSKDILIDNMEPELVLERYWAWEGIIGYSHEMINTVNDIMNASE